MNVQRGVIGVVGAGQMGSGIAQVAIEAGYKVILCDVNKNILNNSRQIIIRGLTRKVTKGLIEEKEKLDALGRLDLETKLIKLQDADIVIETASEDPGIKKRILSELDSICSPKTIIASNTTSIAVTTLGSFTKHPERVVGMHFINPVPLMKSVDAGKGLQTSEESFNEILELAKNLGKEVIIRKKDFLGLGGYLPFINESINLLYEEMTTPKDLDKAFKIALQRPMGPIETADYIGLDTCLSVLTTYWELYGEDKYLPSPLLVRMVEAGKVGRKSGEGFYVYREGQA